MNIKMKTRLISFTLGLIAGCIVGISLPRLQEIK